MKRRRFGRLRNGRGMDAAVYAMDAAVCAMEAAMCGMSAHDLAATRDDMRQGCGNGREERGQGAGGH